VSIINTATNTVISTVTIDTQPENQWHSVSVSPDGRQIYVSDLADRTVRIITIAPPAPQENRAPVAGTPSVGTPNGVTGSVSGSLNFTDPDGNSLTYSVPTQPTSGTVTVNAGNYTFTPTQAARDAAAQTPGPDFVSLTVVASDGQLSTPVTFSVPIVPPNRAPTAGVPAVGTPNTATGSVTGALNFTDPDGDSLTYSVPTQPTSGTVTVNAGSYTFTPNQAARDAAAFTAGPDSVTFTVNASDGLATTPVSVTVPISPAVVSSSAQTGFGPMGVAVSETKTYVANRDSNTVSVIDRANPSATPVTINVVATPTAIALGPQGSNRAYVAGNNAVSVINTSTNQVIATVNTNGGQSYGLAVGVLPDGQQRLYVGMTGNNRVAVINISAATPTVITTVAVGTTPGGVAVSADGNRVYVANFGSNSVSVINTATNTTVGSAISVGANPAFIAVGPNGQVYVSNHSSGTVSVINTVPATPTVSTITVGAQPFGLAISPDRSRVYVVNGNDTVSIINTATNTVISTVTIDTQPENQWHSVSVSPDGRQIYVSDLADRTVRIVTVSGDGISPL
ncbi:MAG TPA: Ig-like domain-containing protein, partial [Mycobacterium sp.]|nr:Ig-like domain-containing protein [Mycobacterium sp.]